MSSSTAATLMFQGTGSDVGKSLLVAGLCRYYKRQGFSVAPFKPQNMSNNAAVTCEGGEIGRAQALQARACGIAPSLDMNPILLKPQSDIGSQVIVQGQRRQNMSAREYHRQRIQFMPAILESYQRLTSRYDIVLVEGAGSPAEINLRQGDIANMGFALASKTPVILIGDIERGGVIASLAGTYHILPPAERALIKGSIINKFRGDISLFDKGRDLVAHYSQAPCLGVLPYFDQASDLPAEDSMALAAHSASTNKAKRAGCLKICVLQFPHIANFDDLDPLRLEPSVDLEMLPLGTPIPGDCDLVILPGTKTTLTDLSALQETGWDIDLKAHHRRGGWILGLCGGYQMMGTDVHDPHQIEGTQTHRSGLGFFNLSTQMTADKTLTAQTVKDCLSGHQVSGYEMHIGASKGSDLQRGWFQHQDARQEGVAMPEKRLFGTYMHGLFSADAFRHAFLSQMMPESAFTENHLNYQARIDQIMDKFADHIETYLDMDRLNRCFSQQISTTSRD